MRFGRIYPPLLWLVLALFNTPAQTQVADRPSQKTFSIPIEFCQDHGVVLLPVSVDGRRYQFILDTGADRTVVSKEASGINPVDIEVALLHRSGPGMRGDAVLARVALQVGESVSVELTVLVMEMKDVRKIYGKVDGLVGQDFLKKFSRVIIDHKSMRLVLEQ
ncbi:MAG: retropepsin-like aspartic protease [Terriglobia bacterium]|nr:retropepsin-like aspartic protease [Terriglobia bacterium]